ncbi:MAG: molybdopterin-binding protein [Candidatus Bathyarchaeia archaeon]
MVCRVELLCIGNEILIGKTLNTNAHWLSQKITGLGAEVTRVTVVEDDVEAIGSALHEILGRRPDLVLTSGGLGPTFDDKTLEAFSRAFNRPLRLNRHALRLVRSRYRRILEVRNPRLTPPQLKMAKLPQGAKAITNPVGTAPAVTLTEGEVKFIILPGVPEELQSIFNRSVSAEIRKMAGRRFFYEASYIVSGILESQIAPLIDQVMNRSPEVYVKSHAKVGEGRDGSFIELHFSSRAGHSRRAKHNVLRAIEVTTELLGGVALTRLSSRD